MITNSYIFKLIIFFLISGFLFTACKDDDNNKIPDDDNDPKEMQILTGIMNEDKVLKNIFNDSEKADYKVVGSFRVRARLIIEPGVRIIMSENSYLYITTDGILVANGTEDNKIVITGEEQQKGWWGYIQFDSKHANNLMNHVIMEYGGNHHDNAFKAILVIRQGGSVKITNSIIRHSLNLGLILGSTDRLPDFLNVQITDNKTYPVRVRSNSLRYINESIRFENNGIQKIEVIASVVEGNQIWKKTKVPFYFSGATLINSDIVLEPGFHAIFNQGASIQVEQEGTLNAIGNQKDSIRFESDELIKGYWNYIHFERSQSVKNEFRYVSLSHGGGHHDRNSIIYIRGGNLGAYLKMSNSSVRNSIGFGVKTSTQGVFDDGGGNNFSGNVLGDIGG